MITRIVEERYFWRDDQRSDFVLFYFNKVVICLKRFMELAGSLLQI